MYNQKRSPSNNKRGDSRSYKQRPFRSKKRKVEMDSSRFIKAAKPIEETFYTSLNDFSDFSIADVLKDNLERRNFVKPTKIQDSAIPVALEGRDIIGIANTGTGKTAAFLLPILNKILNDNTQKALIIAPTRELALQIEKECKHFSAKCKISRAILIGGTPYREQFHQLNKNPKIIIATPGRLKDHLERNTVNLEFFKTVVLDEVDLMLDMGFINDVRTILSKLHTERQSLFFSATISPSIENLIKDFTNNAKTICVSNGAPSDNIDQSVLHYRKKDDKIDHLYKLLSQENVTKALVFSSTKIGTEDLCKELSYRGLKTDAIHGDKPQYKRQKAIQKFRDNNINVLVATDVAARGIDINGISHVVNFDTPQSYSDYTHRIGRTGRGNNIGYAITFVQQH